MIETESIQYDTLGFYDITTNESIEQICNESFPYLIKDILEYIEVIKKSKYYSGESLVEIITQYALDNKIDIRLIGDAISEDEYFKTFIKHDAEHHGYLEKEISEEW